MNDIKIISLFAGVGGFDRGLQRASQRFKTIAYCDNNLKSSSVFKRSYPSTPQFGDIYGLKGSDFPVKPDLIVGGPPCQAFSVAGKRQGRLDPRGTLFWEAARLAQECGYPHLLIENVTGMLSSEHGETFKEILATMDDIGYDVEWQVLNTKDFGIPQNRKRVFIVGHPHSGCRCTEQVFPVPEDGGLPQQADGAQTGDTVIYDGFNDNIRLDPSTPTLSTVNCASVTDRTGFAVGVKQNKSLYDTLDSRPEIGEAHRVYGVNGPVPPLKASGPHIIKVEERPDALIAQRTISNKVNVVEDSPTLRSCSHRNDAVMQEDPTVFQLRRNYLRENKSGLVPTLTANMGTGGNNVPLVDGRQVFLTERRTEEGKAARRAAQKEGRDHTPFRAKEIVERTDGLSGTLTANHSTELVLYNGKYYRFRRLMPIECERLQDFDDNWTQFYHDGTPVPDTKRYEMMGNAVTVRVIEWIGRRMLNAGMFG